MTTPGRTRRGGRRSAHLIRALIAFIGYVLSPLTPWNDAFVNIPLALAIAFMLHWFTHIDVKDLFLACYVFTNVLGIALMIAAGLSYVKERLTVKSVVISVLLGVLVYLFLWLLSA